MCYFDPIHKQVSSKLTMTAPLCATENANPNASAVIPHIGTYNSNIFITQILNSFTLSSTKSSLTYVCENMEPTLNEAFYLDTPRTRNTICEAAGISASDIPAPESPAPSPCPNATATFINQASSLFAYEAVAGISSPDDLGLVCSNFDYFITQLAEEGLDDSIVRTIVCGTTQPLTIAQGGEEIGKWSTKLFISIVLNVASVEGWAGWLCKNLDVAAMDAIKLNGTLVKSEICDVA